MVNKTLFSNHKRNGYKTRFIVALKLRDL